jgi:hypothetical protein
MRARERERADEAGADLVFRFTGKGLAQFDGAW